MTGDAATTLASRMGASMPAYEPDVFDPDALHAPFEHYRALRDLGPVVHLRRQDVYALARFNHVRDALRADTVLVSGDGVGFNDVVNRAGSPNVIQSDGALHSRLRAEVVRPLLPKQLRQHRDRLKALIAERIAELVDSGPFEAIGQIAQLLPVTAISELVGLPEEGRAAMLDWAAATFNSVGPMHPNFDADLARLGQARTYLTGLGRNDLREGSWSRSLFEAADAGRLSAAEAAGALSAFVMPSLDTTILAKGHLLFNLARNPDQWRLLKQDFSLIPNAVLEGVRHSSVIRWFSRVAKADYPVAEQTIPAGSRVMVIYASANRDERQFQNPERFDITRDATSHLAWGTGPHMCAGMHLARIEMEVMLEALVERCAALEAGEPEITANRGLYGFSRLPFELRSVV